MVNPWFPSGSASALSPPLSTAGDSRSSIPPIPPDPPDLSCPFPLSYFPPLSSSSTKTSRRSPRTALLGPVESTSGPISPLTAGASFAPAPESVTSSTDPRITVQNSRSEITVGDPSASETLTLVPPKASSPTLTNKATSSNLPLIQNPPLNSKVSFDPPLRAQGFTPPLSTKTITFNVSQTLSQTPPQQPTTPSNTLDRPNPSLVERLRKSHDKSLTRLAPISLSDSGRPRVLIPDSVFLKGAELHRDFIICHFNGRPPPFNQIQSVLNHMWGKGKRVEIHNNPLSRSMLVRIPNDYLRQKILEKNVWYVGDSMFHASQWSSGSGNSTPREVIQIWAHLTGVPLDLRYKDGLSLVAGLVGEPKETDDFTLNLVSLELSHVKVEVKLSEPLPRMVEFVRQSGEVVEVQVDYPWLPPTCAHCKELGHISRNCLLLPAPPLKIIPQGSKKPSKVAPKAASTRKIYVSIAAPSAPLDTLPSDLPPSSLPSTVLVQPSLPPTPPPSSFHSSVLPVSQKPHVKPSDTISPIPLTQTLPQKTIDVPSCVAIPSPLASSPLVSTKSSSPLTFTSPEGFLFPFSPPASIEKTTLKRSNSNPNLPTFSSFMSQLAYFSSLTPLTPKTLSFHKNPSPSSLALPTSNQFDILVTKSALQPEGPQNL
ncbi:hypothetical protein N665_2939s0007 [Sinapis alba]|nr:hypothetical protein N665_2939s0007 [Sinapis alba]